MKQVILLIISLSLLTAISSAQNGLCKTDHGIVTFKSDASLEFIEANSSHLRGVINPITKSFAFSVNISSFRGFNNDNQRIHFLENYMEQKQFPEATFTGKFIEDIPFDLPGTYSVRAKGILNVHGISKERIIRGTVIIKNDSAQIMTNFLISLEDHGIAIPRIVNQKIAEQIAVAIDIDFGQEIKS